MYTALQKFTTLNVRTTPRFAEKHPQLCCLIYITAILNLSPPLPMQLFLSSLLHTLLNTVPPQTHTQKGSGNSHCNLQSLKTFPHLHLCLGYLFFLEYMSSCFYCVFYSVFYTQCKPYLKILSQNNGALPWGK